MDTTEIRSALRKAGEAAERIRAFALGADDLPCPEDCAHLLADCEEVHRGDVAARHLLARLGIEPEHKIALYDMDQRDLVGAAWQGSKIVQPPPVARPGSHCRAMRAPGE